MTQSFANRHVAQSIAPRDATIPFCHHRSVNPQLRAHAGAVNAAVADWLESQVRIVAFCRELAFEAACADELIAALDAHVRFLDTVSRGLGKPVTPRRAKGHDDEVGQR